MEVLVISPSQAWLLHMAVESAKAAIDSVTEGLEKGAKAFLWTPPLGVLGLYKCNGYKPVHRGGQVYAITATFEQTFHP
nr:phage tail protein [Pseudomonas sp. MIACH]